MCCKFVLDVVYGVATPHWLDNLWTMTQPVISANWATEQGDLGATIKESESNAAAVKLHKQVADAGPCTITCNFQQPLVST